MTARALAKRLDETNHALADQLRWTGIRERLEPQQPTEKPDVTRIVTVNQGTSLSTS
jgi:hypothetical protein